MKLRKGSLDLTGQVFTNLTAVKPVESKKRGGTVWECECKCGNTVYAVAGKLRIGHVKSCGCYKNENIKPRFGKDHWAWNGHNKISGSIWCRVKSAAEKRSKDFDISIEYVWKLFQKQDGKCAISGEKIDFARSSKELKQGLNTASLDRIDSNKGYVRDNVQWVHVDVNYMKQALDQDKFINWCKKNISK